MADRSELHEQLLAAFDGAAFPVAGPGDLAPALPEGAATRFESGDFAVTALGLTTRYRAFEFPYESAEAAATDVLDELEAVEAI